MLPGVTCCREVFAMACVLSAIIRIRSVCIAIEVAVGLGCFLLVLKSKVVSEKFKCFFLYFQ